jgi:hypothetical protein
VSYFLSFGNGTLKIRDINGTVVASNTGYSWTTATAKNIVFAPAPRAASGIDVVITFAGQVPKIARYTNGGTWTFLDFAFATNGTAKQEPFYRINVPGATLQASAATGSVTLTASQAYFTAGMVGAYLLYLNSQVLITAFTDSTHVTATVLQTIPLSDTSTSGGIVGSFAPGDIVINHSLEN